MLVLAVRFFASGIPVAAQVHVAVFVDVVEAEAAEGIDVVVEGGVGVPGVAEAAAVRVDED